MRNTNSVTVIADHITGDNRLINFGCALTEKDGSLYITHIENSQTYYHYIDIISKIPGLNTDIAREKILEKLLNEPKDFIDSCATILKEQNFGIQIKPVVKLGHAISDYKKHITDHSVDLLILHTKDETQLAMNGMSYSLCVELKELPLLLI